MFCRRQKESLLNTSTGKLNSRLAGDVQGLTSKYQEWLMLEEYRKKEDGREEKGKKGREKERVRECSARERFANFLGEEKLDYEI